MIARAEADLSDLSQSVESDLGTRSRRHIRLILQNEDTDVFRQHDLGFQLDQQLLDLEG